MFTIHVVNAISASPQNYSCRLLRILFLSGSISDIFDQNDDHEDDSDETSERIENVNDLVERNDRTAEYASNYEYCNDDSGFCGFILSKSAGDQPQIASYRREDSQY